MSSIAIPSGWSLKVWVAVVAMLGALGVVMLDASPAFAAGTVNVSVGGKGDVTAPGINCNESGGPDCSEFYADTIEEECPDPRRPASCFIVRTDPTVEFTAGPDRDGHVFDGWTGCDPGPSRNCSATISDDRTVTARFRDTQAPGISAASSLVWADEGQSATNSGTFSDNGSGNVTITASRGTVSKTGTNSGSWTWSESVGDGPAPGTGVTITARDAAGNVSTASFSFAVRNVAPVATVSAPAGVDEASTFEVSVSDVSDASAADRTAGFTYQYNCDGGGFAGYSSRTSMTCQAGDGPATRSVQVSVKDKDGGERVYTREVLVRNLAPSATLNAPASANDGTFFVVSMSSPDDASLSDRNGGFTYAFDCGDGSYGDFSGTPARRCEANAGQGGEVRAKVRDKDGGERAYGRAVTVNAAPPSYPNGRISFSRSGTISTMKPDGSQHASIAPGSDATLSPDGRTLVYANQFGEVYRSFANGAQRSQIFESQGDIADFTFSPDGSKVAFSRTYQNPPFGNAGEIYLMNADGTGSGRFASGSGNQDDPDLAPNGSQIAFARRVGYFNNDYLVHYYDIFVANVDGSGATNLTSRLVSSTERSGEFFQPSFSPDGSQIAFASNFNGSRDIYVMNADGTGLTRLTNDPAPDENPDFAPDGVGGNRLVFAKGSGNAQEIYTMRAVDQNGDGTGDDLVRLTDNNVPDTAPSWGGAADATPPDTSITSRPTSRTNSSRADFEFGASESNPVFECRLDGNAFAPCTSPVSYYLLADGTHTFEVRATDTSGNGDPTPATHSWSVDATGPTVSGTSPSDGASNVPETDSVTVTFSKNIDASTVDANTFRLRKENIFRSVPATVTYDAATRTATLDPTSALDSRGTYTATVTSGIRDTSGNGLSPERSWTFTTADTTPPNVDLFSPEPGSKVGPTIHLAAGAGDLSGIERIEFLVNDSLVFSDSEYPFEYDWDASGVATGETVRVAARAVDNANNTSAPDVHTVTVDKEAPETRLEADPGTPAEGATVALASATFSFSAEAGATFECSLDDGAFAPCDPPEQYQNLTEGPHVFKVRATDEAGNVDASPAERRWIVNRAPTVLGNSLTPPSGATGVPRNTNASATFSEAMNGGSINATTVKLQQYNKKTKKWKTIPAKIALSDGDTKVTLDPFGATEPAGTEQPLAADKKFRVTISTGVRDAGGIPLVRSFVWTFTTGRS